MFIFDIVLKIVYINSITGDQNMKNKKETLAQTTKYNELMLQHKMSLWSKFDRITGILTVSLPSGKIEINQNGEIK